MNNDKLSETNRSCSTGQAALTMVFLVGGTAVLIGITLSFVIVSLLTTTAGFQAANQALAAAHAGAQDAIIQLARNKSFSSVNQQVPGGSFPAGTPFAVVTVQQDTPISNQATITSESEVRGSQRKIQVVVSVNPTTGEIRVISWKQVAI